MNVLVCAKHAVDESELKADESGKPKFQNAQMKMSTFDRNAVEEAVRIREARGGSTAVMTLGVADARKTLREALAMGIDRGYIITTNPDDHDALTTSYFLARAISKIGGFDLVICAEGASDTYHGQVGAMIGASSGSGCVRGGLRGQDRGRAREAAGSGVSRERDKRSKIPDPLADNASLEETNRRNRNRFAR
ncbi:MAG: hypothetical protein HYW93_00985 [Thaumarchaeota archaeon]|nr:hypothetical protein [Nitrososphaerota archaeon]